jgi:EAL domain-containing protein (putative c-di-GMP-specific phosphodiesterase class I)
MVQSILKETGLPASRLELEVTESSLFSDSNMPITILKKLRALGVKISIDDFGTGYSSLSRLSELNFDKIKIDKSFVNPISTQDDALNIVKLITGMAKSLNMRVIAEVLKPKRSLNGFRRLAAISCRDTCSESHRLRLTGRLDTVEMVVRLFLAKNHVDG